jgi:hypothetical protein
MRHRDGIGYTKGTLTYHTVKRFYHLNRDEINSNMTTNQTYHFKFIKKIKLLLITIRYKIRTNKNVRLIY